MSCIGNKKRQQIRYEQGIEHNRKMRNDGRRQTLQVVTGVIEEDWIPDPEEVLRNKNPNYRVYEKYLPHLMNMDQVLPEIEARGSDTDYTVAEVRERVDSLFRDLIWMQMNGPKEMRGLQSEVSDIVIILNDFINRLSSGLGALNLMNDRILRKLKEQGTDLSAIDVTNLTTPKQLQNPY
eukprot:CAMPEP_0114978536 /NCGR_PEP_ID=MMETSP0216-20121206/3862_1 /TAXON_ID=223996 /ORGANISM="Protocruzia adherens, Strain Boccale" /LENGTH=179 /DNA_ID=CAMNT_0002339745 /DNA_START=150 /DNA_END=689 /DNA_ORIENTATION=-